MKRSPITIRGTVTAVTLPAAGEPPVFRVDVQSGQERWRLAFVGYSRLPGCRVGRELEATGVEVATSEGTIIFNPVYSLMSEMS